MADFEVPVVRVSKVEKHPNADRLDLVYFRDFAVVSAKLEDGSPRYKAGDLVVYVPEGSIVPEYLLRQGFWDEKNNKGMLAGSQGNRVKAIKLRGILSQGIMFPVIQFDWGQEIINRDGDLEYHPQLWTMIQNWDDDPATWDTEDGLEPELELHGRVVKEGDNVAKYLRITKYEPEIPASMSGDVVYIEGVEKFDVENIKKYPHVLLEDEEVVVTEKLHGTMMGIGFIPGLDRDDLWEREIFCFSEGMGNKGLVFKNSENNRERNVYVRELERLLEPYLVSYLQAMTGSGPLFLFGELAGRGIQDLHYGLEKPEFRLFDVYDPKGDGWFSWPGVVAMARCIGVKTVPVIYRGIYNADVVRSLAKGNSTMADHVIEGVVVKPVNTRYDQEIGRVILKVINDEYLLRKNGTEYN
jgi:RNA ligase (TIGR02306 family)